MEHNDFLNCFKCKNESLDKNFILDLEVVYIFLKNQSITSNAICMECFCKQFGKNQY